MSRTLLPAFTTHLNGTILFLCNMCLITRLDGEQFGFTSHDRDLTYDSVTYEAFSSVDATEVRQSAGGGVDNLQVVGLLKSDRITDVDLRAGIYDGATVELFQVNWADLTMGRLLVLTGTIGEISHQSGQYTAEVRSLSQRLSQQIVELTSSTCRVRALGDRRCLPPEDTSPSFVLTAFQHTRLVGSVQSLKQITFAGDSNVTGYYNYGRVRFNTGANANIEREIKSHTNAATMIDPLTLTGLQLYLRSDQVAGADGSTVTSWPDLSGHGRTASLTGYTGATGPTLRTTGANISPNGTRMVEFGGATTTGLKTASFNVSATNGLTVYTYYKQVSLTDSTGGQILTESSSGGVEIPARGGAGGGYTAGRHGVRLFAAPTAIRSFNESADLGYHLLTTVFATPINNAANTIIQYKDGVQLTPTYNYWNQTGSSSWHVGNNGGPNGVFRGTLGALLVFNDDHDATTRAAVEAWLQNYFATVGAGTTAVITLQEAFPFTVAVGDSALLEAGCDRTTGAGGCARFNNLVNFQGEPNIPGVDQIQERGRR